MTTKWLTTTINQWEAETPSLNISLPVQIFFHASFSEPLPRLGKARTEYKTVHNYRERVSKVLHTRTYIQVEFTKTVCQDYSGHV